MKYNEESNYKPVEKGTFQNVKGYILEKYGLKVYTLYIALIKDKCELGKGRTGNNWTKNEDAKVPKCPPEKEIAIMDAFRYFEMLSCQNTVAMLFKVVFLVKFATKNRRYCGCADIYKLGGTVYVCLF